MDTPLPSAVHKENVHIGGGKATVLKKPDKVKAGKDRKALADLRSTHGPAVGLSKDIDLKLKSAFKGSEVKKNPMMRGRQQKADADLSATKKHVTRVSEGANLNAKSVLLSNSKGNGHLDHILTDEEIKQCYEWANDGVEEMGGYSWSEKDERDLCMNQTISEIMASAIGIPVAELEQSLLSDEEGYETDRSDLHSSMSFPEELDDPLGVARIVLDEYPLPELMLDEDFNFDNDDEIDGR